jgi:hypothetical protein
MIDLALLRKELKLIVKKSQSEYKAEGKIGGQKVTFQSFYYHLKTTAEVLGIKNKDFMNIQSNALHQRVS